MGELTIQWDPERKEISFLNHASHVFQEGVFSHVTDCSVAKSSWAVELHANFDNF